jgi:hypothetical protein
MVAVEKVMRAAAIALMAATAAAQGRGPREQVSKAAWDGSRLVITTVHHFDVASNRDGGKTPPGARTPMTSDTRHVLWFEGAGVLAIETTHSGMLGGQPSTMKTLYQQN